MSLTLNGALCASMKWTAAWNGVWIAEVDLLPATPDALPSGVVAIVSTGGIALTGTVDPEHTAAFADRRRVRVRGGGGGWGKPVRDQHYHSPVTVPLAQVLSTTAAEVGEVTVLLEPKSLGQDYVRHAGPASQVFSGMGVDWWVDATGITRVGTRPELPASADVRVLDWNEAAGTMSFAADKLVEPGTVLVDDRFGRRVVRRVEALVADAAVTGTLYVAEAAPAKGASSDIVAAIKKIARDETRPEYGRFHMYQVDALRGDEVELISDSKTMPNLIPCKVWAGTSGYRAKLRLGTRVLVGFREGDIPFVAFYESPDGEWRPVEIEIDALEKVTIGGVAEKVVLGVEASALPIARAPAIQAFADALGKALDAMAAAEALKPPTPPATHTDLAVTFKALATAVKAAAEAMKDAMPSATARAA